MHDTESYRKLLQLRGINLSDDELVKLMNLLDAVLSITEHVVKKDNIATEQLAYELNRHLVASGESIRFEVIEDVDD